MIDGTHTQGNEMATAFQSSCPGNWIGFFLMLLAFPICYMDCRKIVLTSAREEMILEGGCAGNHITRVPSLQPGAVCQSMTRREIFAARGMSFQVRRS